jgi:hypothetical protein
MQKYGKMTCEISVIVGLKFQTFPPTDTGPTKHDIYGLATCGCRLVNENSLALFMWILKR